jgi:hypothetical protein
VTVGNEWPLYRSMSWLTLSDGVALAARLQNVVEHRRGAFQPFSAAPFSNRAGDVNRTRLSREPFHSSEYKVELMHYAANQLKAILKRSSCRPWPCDRISRSPW